MIELAVFLGNPGPQYQHNRHNAAWLFAETLSFYNALSWKDKFKGRYASLDGPALLRYAVDAATDAASVADAGTAAATADVADTGMAAAASARDAVSAAVDAGRIELPEKVLFLFPQTFMNLSGESLSAAASFFKIKTENILVVHDELELPLGTVSLKYSGGLGGHNGLRSIKAALGSADFWRLRIGIGRPGHRDIYSWVLSDFSPDETAVLAGVFKTLDRFFVEVLSAGPAALLPEWKKKSLTPNNMSSGVQS